MARIVVFGIGQIAETICSYLRHESAHEVVALTVDAEYIDREIQFGLPVVPFSEVQTKYPPDEHMMFVAVSYRSMNRTREAKCSESRAKGYRLASHVSPRAVVSPDVTIGDNCFVCEHNVLQPFVCLADGVMMGDGNHIGHHTNVGPYCFITSHVVVCGSVEVGPRSFLGANATIRDRVRIGEESVIGAGALILRDAPPGSVWVGVGARRAPGDTTNVFDL
jgi:sugar O-acyltransferase (sialic acid O-acetyltransferase NeuD family)